MRASDYRNKPATAIARHPMFVVIVAAVVLAAALWASSVRAAPQALALVSTHGPIELICDNGECSIELTTYCLQQDRPAPEDGTAYEVAFGELRLEGITADGTRITLDPKEAFKFTTQRTYTAMRVSLSDDLEGAEKFTAIDMFVPENVALVPMAVAGDPTPLTEMEVAMIGQSLRPFGNQIIDRDAETTGAARILNRTINRLPRDGWGDPELRQKAWEDAVSSPDGQATSPKGLHRAKRSFELCEWGENVDSWSSMRQCMEIEHDQMIREKNTEYWKGMDVGI